VGNGAGDAPSFGPCPKCGLKRGVCGDTAGEDGCRVRGASRCAIEAIDEDVDDGRLKRCRDIGGTRGATGIGIEKVLYRRFNTGKRHVERVAGRAVTGKRDRFGVARARETIDLGAAGKRQPEEARGFIECFARGIVARFRDDAKIRRIVDGDDLRVTARDQEREKRVRRLDAGVDERRENMAVKMIDGVERFARRICDRFCRCDADDETADEPRSRRHRDAVEIGERNVRAFERVLHGRAQKREMLAARDLRNDAAEFRVKRVLIRRDVGECGLAVADDGRRRVVARRFDSQKQHDKKITFAIVRCRSGSALVWGDAVETSVRENDRREQSAAKNGDEKNGADGDCRILASSISSFIFPKKGSWGPAVQRAASVMAASRTESLAFSPTPSTLDLAIDELEEIGSSSGGAVSTPARRAALAMYLGNTRMGIPRHVRLRHDYEALGFDDLVWSSGRMRVATLPQARATPASGSGGDAPSLAVENSGGIVHAGSTYLQPSAARGDDRLTIVALADAVRARAARDILGYIARIEDDRFIALATAFQNCGAYVEVPPGVALDAPVQIVWTGAPGATQAIFPQIVVRVGANARVTIVERHVGNVDAFVCGSVELEIAAGARVDYVVVQEIDDGARILMSRAARCAGGAIVAWHLAELGGALAYSSVASHLVGNASTAETNELAFARGFGNVDLRVGCAHVGERSTSQSIVRAAAIDRGVVRVACDVTIGAGAHRSDAATRIDGLVLSRDAYLEAVPSLEVATNDIAAAHAATIGSLDEEQLFYVRTRGISRGRAERMLALAFFEPAIARFPGDALRDEVRTALDKRLDEVADTFAS
jgi:Fe-S cluster assembly protein SufD